MITKKITINTRDIAGGDRGNFCSCPAALALSRAFKGKKVRVGYDNVLVGDHGDKAMLVASLPALLHDWIETFDHKGPVEPLTVTLHFRELK